MNHSPKSKRQAVIRMEPGAENSAQLIGWKARNLFILNSAGLPIPQGFVISSEVLTEPLRSVQLPERWTHSSLACFRKKIQESTIPESLLCEIRKAYRELATTLHEPFGVSVRSSAAEEDLSLASFAGQFETFLNVRSFQDLIQSVRDVWISAFTEQVISYMIQHDLTPRLIRMAVLVQKIVPADVSGVAFGLDPESGSKSRIYIEATWGLGDVLVGGRITPDVFVIEKKTLKIVRRKIVQKKMKSICGAAPWPGVLEIPVPKRQIGIPCLNDLQLAKVGRIVNKVEKNLGEEMDIEWCMFRGKIILLQARPITAIA